MSEVRSREAVALAAARTLMRRLDEDVMAEARLGALLCPSVDAPVIWLAARNAAVDYLRRMCGRKDEWDHSEKRPVSLDKYSQDQRSSGDGETQDLLGDEVSVGFWNKDEQPAWEQAEKAVEARDIWRSWRKLLTPAQHAAVYRWLFLGESQKEVARALRCHPSWVQQLQRAALDRLLDDAGWPKGRKRRGRWRGD